jgi:hypothetical protein
MGHSRPGRAFVFAALLLGLSAGCQTLPGYRPVVILARDADTKKPIPEAAVRLSYPLAQISWPSWDSRGVTGNDGIVRLQAASQGDAPFLVELTAHGYLPEAKLVPAETVRTIEPAHLFEAVEGRPVSLVLEMVAAQPIPRIELVVANGYRGLVEVELRVQEEASCTPGQRSFSCVVPPTGAVQVSVPPLLQRFGFPDFSARYADGTPLKGTATDAEVGFWELKAEGLKYTFLVGTQAERTIFRVPAHESPGEKPSSGGGKGRGRGRGNRHSDPPASDP